MGKDAETAAKAELVRRRYGATTKGTAEAAKPGKWKVKKVDIGKDGKSFAVEFKKKI